MQAKTIEKVIKNKINIWLSTINDKDLVKRVKQNYIVTGGCITSMLLNEKVNDYDVYIQDQDVLYDLIKYYVGDNFEVWKGSEKVITLVDGEKVEVPQEVFNTFNSFRSSSDKLNALKNLKENQVKIFTNIKHEIVKNETEELFTKGGCVYSDEYGEREAQPFLRKLKNANSKYHIIYLSDNSITFSENLQLITRFCGNPDEIHKNFDFVHTINYYTEQTGLVTNPRALESILTKQLYYQGSLYPLTSVIRLRKFIERGWKINAGEIVKILFQISKMDLSDVSILEEQLIGVDTSYFSSLIEIFRKDKEEGMGEISSEYFNKVIDEVFGN